MTSNLLTSAQKLFDNLCGQHILERESTERRKPTKQKIFVTVHFRNDLKIQNWETDYWFPDPVLAFFDSFEIEKNVIKVAYSFPTA